MTLGFYTGIMPVTASYVHENNAPPPLAGGGALSF